MATLKELQAKNKKLKAQLEDKKKLEKLQKEKNELIRENKKILRESKFGKELDIARGVGKSLKSGSKIIAKSGFKIGKALIKHAKKIAEADRKEELARNRKRKKSSKKKKRK